MRWLLFIILAAAFTPGLHGGDPATRRVPPPGIEIAPAARAELQMQASRLAGEIEALRRLLEGKALLELLPDVEIFHKAVHWATIHDEFYRSNEVVVARELLQHGSARAAELRRGDPSWISATGLVVRGYVSKLDGSVQPYGLVVPASYQRGRRCRLDVWLHGRDNNLTELKFIQGRLKSPGEFTPPDTLVLHPYGRYCNAFKFAGEVDVFEALDHVRRHYDVDADRLGIRGFSMGGAGCWHLAAHHGGFWAAAAPGAGFAETAEYAGILARNPNVPWYEQTLWKLYDATAYAPNLVHCPTIAYSGEIDKQKQAADVMARAMAAAQLELTHIIGPQTAHKYEPRAKAELNRRFDELMKAGRDPSRLQVRFTTWTLRYNKMLWVTLDGLEKHWRPAHIDAISFPDGLEVTTRNIDAFTLTLPQPTRAATVDGQRVAWRHSKDEGTHAVHFRKRQNRWKTGFPDGSSLVKRPGLQGPIDDAFMESFLMVRPTSIAANQKVENWVQAEFTHATNEWRAQFRGDAPVKDDVDVTTTDIANHNLILWGDPSSNKLLARIADRLPVKWSARTIRAGKDGYDAVDHIPVLIHPNPLNPKKYVVLNSGFTACEAGDSSNALQTPKLPDWAIIKMDVARSRRLAEGVVAAGFFDEHWKLTRDRGK